jgi:uncharacterized membrane protein YhaH (DUF805 family)
MLGRINRAAYWLVLGGFVALYVLISMVGARPPRIGEGLLIFLCAARLHDLGKSGWWVLIPLSVELGAVIVAIAAFSTEDDYALLGGAFVAIAAFVLVLGLIPGQPHANRFGEPPKGMFPSRERRKVSETEEIFK